MLPRLSTLSLILGITTLPATVFSICTSGVLCGLNTRALVHKRFWGTCIQTNETDSHYVALTLNYDEFGMVTPIQGFEMSTLQPSQGGFDFTATDKFVSYWHSNAHAQLWIHTLLPTAATALPGWLTNSVWSKSQLISIIQDYVATVAGHYRGQVYAWDVVSEIFEDNGKWRSNVFYDVLGPDYVQIALVAARSADPDAKLYIEEYGAEEGNVKSDALFYLAQDLKNNGVPLDGIGFEGHSVTPQIPAPSSVMVNTQRFEALDLDWAYTQLGVRIAYGSATLGRQAEDYNTVLTTCLWSPRCVGALTSGITDTKTIEGTGSWGGPPWSETLFDANYVPIISYNVIANYLTVTTVDGDYI